MFIFISLTSSLRSQAEWSAGGQGLLQDSADRGVDRAEEDVEVGGALDLHQGEEGVGLHAGVLLLRVTLINSFLSYI